MKTSKTLIDLLVWAFRDELPKCKDRGDDRIGAPGYASIDFSSYIDLLTKIDGNRYGVVPDIACMGEPHRDALVIGNAVLALDDLEIDEGEDYSPLADFADIEDEGRLALKRVLRDMNARRNPNGCLRGKDVGLSYLVTHAALFRTIPDWPVERPDAHAVRDQSGRERWFVKNNMIIDGQTTIIETNGYNKRTKLPVKGAYRKYIYEPTLEHFSLERFNYSMTILALHHLKADIEYKLDDHKIIAFDLSIEPWKLFSPQSGVLRA